VQPGVIVQAMGNYQITAQGNIMAIGTVQDSIKFVSGQADPNALWKGIRLENTTSESVFSYCRIELGDYGINSINSPATIAFSHFKRNKRGIQAYGIGSAEPAQVLIDHNLIELTVQNGILVAQNSNTTITNNEITKNGTSASYYGAIQLSNQSTGGSNNPEIAYNHIHHNYKQGLIAWDIVSANAINPEVHHNLIENNLTGIYFRHSSGYLHHNTVRNNFILGDMNSGAGIMVSGNTAQPYFEDNIVTGNYTGFYLTENANPILGNMAIDHAWAQGGNTISNNIDANNVMHSIFCYSYTISTIIVKAENNIWDYTSATEIASTIEDNFDNPSLPTIDFSPWQTPVIPIYLAGTVTMTNPPVPTATLELVSAVTGNILDTWTVDINQPFSVPVYHDSLVYIVAHTIDMIEYFYYGAFGGTANPTATQIIADVQFSIGDVPLSFGQPDWYYSRFETPRMINGHFSYPYAIGWFVYAPFKRFCLFRDGDYLWVSRFETGLPDEGYSFDLVNPVVYQKITNLSSTDTWQQLISINTTAHEANTAPAHSIAGITTFVNGLASTYDMIKIGNLTNIQIYDYYEDNWINYGVYPYTPFGVYHMEVPFAITVEPDGTLFPMVQNNSWKLLSLPPQQLPTYFGYKAVDSLSFYWVPPARNYADGLYRIYDNGVLVAETIPPNNSVTIPTPTDGIEHTYTLSVFYDNVDHFSEGIITVTFVGNNSEVQMPNPVTVYPNPFNPTVSPLTIKHDSSKSVSTKLEVFNLKGQLVWSASSAKGSAESMWNGKDKYGKSCAPGLYQIRLTDDNGHKISRKIMLIH
jgi:hypothetical protein